MNVAVRAVESMLDISPKDWDACFPDDPENWAYYRAVEEAGLEGFTLFALALFELEGQDPQTGRARQSERAGPFAPVAKVAKGAKGAKSPEAAPGRQGRILAVVPGFTTSYRLDTTVSGPWKRVTQGLAKVAPALLSVRIACLGSPVAERCHLGFAPDIPPEAHPELLRRFLEGFEGLAAARGIGLVAVKDVGASSLCPACMAELAESGYSGMPSLPTALLDLPYADFSGYLESLSSGTRKNMRRKMRLEPRIRVEERHNIDDVLPEVMRSYHETLRRSDLRFETLPEAYFTRVLAEVPGSFCTLYWADGKFAGFNLLLTGPGRLIDKFAGFSTEIGRAYNLYFLSWMYNVRYCLARNIPIYHSGQAGYEVKLRLGSRLAPNWIFFKHRSKIMNALFRGIARLVRLDRFDDSISSGLPT